MEKIFGKQFTNNKSMGSGNIDTFIAESIFILLK